METTNQLGLTDAPILSMANESLDLLDHVEALSEFIRTCQTPLTISFQGDWGSGKTSMMNMVRESLGKSSTRIETRWFNTWQYAQFQMQDDIAISLLMAFLEELDESGYKAKTIVSTFGRMATKVLGRGVKAVTDLTVGTGGDDTKGIVDKGIEMLVGRSDNAKQLTNLKKEIGLAVDALLKKNSAERMVVFIDDLDRLVPIRAVEILETIKLFLDVPNCVFVLAVDYHVVSKGLEQKFNVSMGDLKGKSFFDKIIQLPFSLPVAQYNIRKYIKTLYSNSQKFNDESFDTLVRLAENSIGTNPRSLKRLFNALQLLQIIAKRKYMLETDGIATTEERQRLLFAVLCLQLAYEPVYALLLQDINQNRINTDYFETLSHVENLQANVEMIALVRKALPISHDPVEALIRFTSFMSAFKDSIQLESDKSDENRESISESELDLLRQFLFLSSLTSSAGASVNLLGTFRHKAALLTFIEKTLKPKYQVALSTINSAVFTQFKEREAYIGFTFLMAGLSFSIIICWDDKGLSAGLWDEAGGEKKLVRSWFQTNCPGAVSSWNLYATYGYGIFESKAIDANVDDENQRVVEYQAMIDRTFGWALDKLIPLYNEKYPEILKSRSFADKLFYRLSSTYPSSEGWQVDSQLKSLQRGLLVKIQHPDWNSKLCLAIAAGNSMLRSLYFGIYRLKSQRKFGDREQFFYSNYIDKRFPDEKPIAQSGGDWWVFWKYFSPKFGTLFIGDLSQSSAKFAFDTPEGEDEAIESFVEVMSRFKQILPELKDLADSAEE